MKISKFILIQLSITLAVCALIWFAFSSLYEDKIRGFMCLAVVLAAVAGAASYAITFSGVSRSMRSFTTFLIGGMVLKMFFAIVCMTIIALTMKDLAMHFVLAYFFSYIVFISFEVFSLMTNLRPFSKKVTQYSDEKTGKQQD